MNNYNNYYNPYCLYGSSWVSQVTYTSSKGEHCAQTVEESVAVSKALEVKFSFLSSRCELATKLFARESFMIVPQVDCLAPCPVTIQRTELQLVC